MHKPLVLSLLALFTTLFGAALYFAMPFALGEQPEVAARLELDDAVYLVTRQYSARDDLYFVTLYVRQRDGRWAMFDLENDELYWRGRLELRAQRVDVLRYGALWASYDVPSAVVHYPSARAPQRAHATVEDPLTPVRTAAQRPPYRAHGYRDRR